MKKQITIVTSNIAPYRASWAEGLANYYDVTIIYTKDHDFERDDRWLVKESNNCKLIKLNNRFNNDHNPICFDVINYLKENKDSIIIFDGYGTYTNLIGILYCKYVLRKPFYTNVDGWQCGVKLSSFQEFFKKIILKLNHKFLCSDLPTKEHLMSYGIKNENIYTHNFSSIHDSDILKDVPSKKRINELRQKLNIQADKKIVLTVGRFIDIKRFEDFILSKKYVKTDCIYYLIGGEATTKYQEIIKDNNLSQIFFIDFMDYKDLGDYYECSDLFVLPTGSDVWGLVINEAMSKALPIITTDNCVGGKSLIKDNGMIYKTKDVLELAKDIDLCLEEKTNHAFRKNSLKIIKEYTIENMVKTHREIFENEN